MQTERIETDTREEHLHAARAKGEPKIRNFDLVGHLGKTARAESATKHIRVGLESWMATKLMRTAMRLQPAVPDAYKPRWGQYKQIEKELHSSSTKRRQLLVFTKMPFMGGLRPSGLDFVKELEGYELLDYHAYYQQPFHSLPGGWLSPMAATDNEAAMRALFGPATRDGAEGLRRLVAEQLPSDAKVVYDFGCTCGAQSEMFLERLGPDARVVAIDPSPFGLIYGKSKIKDPRIEWLHAFAEEAPVPDASGDVVNIFFVLHETPDHIKQKLLKKAFDVLKPGGTLLVSEPPLWDLEHRSRGFFEPYRSQWNNWNGRKFIEDAGFTQVKQEDVADPKYVHSLHAVKPR